MLHCETLSDSSVEDTSEFLGVAVKLGEGGKKNWSGEVTLEGETGNEYDVPPGRVDDDALRLLGGLSSV